MITKESEEKMKELIEIIVGDYIEEIGFRPNTCEIREIIEVLTEEAIKDYLRRLP